MKEYLTFAPIIIFLIWLYIAIMSYKGFNNFKKASGKSYITLLNPLNAYKLKEEIKSDKKLEEVYFNYKKSTTKFIKLWVLTLVIFMIISVCIGVLTSGKN